MDALDTIVQTTARLETRGGLVRRPLARLVSFVARGTRHLVRNRQYLSVRKLANMALVNLQALFLRRRVLGRPYRLKIEPTNVCRSTCRLCPTGQGMHGRDFGQMALEDFERLVDRISPYATVLDLGNWGEPLLVPHIFDMVRYAHERRIWTYFATNLHVLHPEKGRADELVLSGLDRLACSFHGTSQATFEMFQPGMKLAVVLTNLEAIIEAKRRLNRRTPEIQMIFVVTRFNQHEQPDFKRLCASFGAEPIFISPSMNVRLLGKGRDLSDLGWSEAHRTEQMRRRFEGWLPNDPDHVVEPYRLMRKGSFRAEEYNGRKIFPCRKPWRDMLINWDGGVAPCPGVFGSEHDMGNVFEDSLPDIWNSTSYRAARQSFRTPTPASAEVKNPCRDCPGFCV